MSTPTVKTTTVVNVTASNTTTRPQVHFTPASGWINDPLGLTFHGGRYHLFFQFVPGQTQWGPNQRWGHATSDDLLHWTEGPTALEPGEGDDGVWSGSIAVPDVGPAALFYTTVDLADVEIGKARIARPTDDTWTTWIKGEIVAELPDGVDVIAYRDPYVFHDGSTWRMLMGAGLAGGTATALTYRSEDLEHWVYDGLLATRHRDQTEPLWTGDVWECPQMFRLGPKWILTVSVWEPGVPHYEAYAIGDLVAGRFTTQSWGRMSYGPSYYAGSAFADQHGDRGLIYWIRGVDDPAGQWASTNSLPHMLHLAGHRVIAQPHATVASRRIGDAVHTTKGVVEVSLLSDLEWTIEALESNATLEFLDTAGKPVMRLAAADASLTSTVGVEYWTMPLTDTEIRIVLDGPVVEIFTNSGVMAFPIPSTEPTRTIHVRGRGSLTTHSLS